MSRYDTFQNANNKGADQTARMRRLVCSFVVRKPPKKVYLALWPICALVEMSMRCMGHSVAQHFLLKQLLKFALKCLLYIQTTRVVLKDGKLFLKSLHLLNDTYVLYYLYPLKAMIKHRLLESQRLICARNTFQACHK